MKTFRLNWGIFGGGVKPSQLTTTPAQTSSAPQSATMTALKATSLL